MSKKTWMTHSGQKKAEIFSKLEWGGSNIFVVKIFRGAIIYEKQFNKAFDAINYVKKRLYYKW